MLTILGRSLLACKTDFDLYRQSGSASASQYTSYTAANLAQKRPHGAIEGPPSMGGGRQLAPKPPAPAPTGASRFQPMNIHQHSPLTGSVSQSADTHRKKRGRPSKKDQEERRKLQAIATGAPGSGIFPSPSMGLPAHPGLSASGEPLGSPLSGSMHQNYGSMFTPQRPAQELSTSGSSGSKKRGRPRKTPSMSISSVNPEAAEYDTPPQTATDRRESVTDTSQPAGSLPPDPGPSASQLEPEESRQPKSSDWQNTILQKPH
jgi:hypothetical protein